jgi:hypothetical protein
MDVPSSLLSLSWGSGHQGGLSEHHPPDGWWDGHLVCTNCKSSWILWFFLSCPSSWASLCPVLLGVAAPQVHHLLRGAGWGLLCDSVTPWQIGLLCSGSQVPCPTHSQDFKHQPWTLISDPPDRRGPARGSHAHLGVGTGIASP